ncbi:MAG: iron-sulfur cluster assembly scaffold protein [Nanoarchaeota archaeon]
MDFDSMSMENILDHYKNPHNKGKVQKVDVINREKNPSCGDEIEVSATLNEKKEIVAVQFDGHGCAISQASISMLTDDLSGKKIEDVMKIKKEDVLELLGIDVAPMRIKCAMLGLRVLQRGILKYEGKEAQSISLSEM